MVLKKENKKGKRRGEKETNYAMLKIKTHLIAGFVTLSLSIRCNIKETCLQTETSMMWPSQNFLLYNGTIM